MLIDWSGEFDRWYDQLIERAEAGDERSVEQFALLDSELGVLQDLRGRAGRGYADTAPGVAVASPSGQAG